RPRTWSRPCTMRWVSRTWKRVIARAGRIICCPMARPFSTCSDARKRPYMLTGKMVRVRYARDRLLPYYLDTADEQWTMLAEQLLDLFRGMQGRTRGELEEELDQLIGDDPSQLVHLGLAKLLEDRCEFEVVSAQPPENIRTAVFRAAAWQRQHGEQRGFERDAVMQQAALELNLPAEDVERGLFADLKSEQHLIEFKDLSAERLLERYNVSLAQAILLRATRVHLTVRNEPPQRYRQLMRCLKFHRLLCEMNRCGADSFVLHIDGPLSLFSSTNKYGLQLALFLPVALLCKDFLLTADIRWGAQRKAKKLQITPKDKLVSQAVDSGMYV